MPAIQIRAFAERDWPQVWSIVRDVVQAEDTFAYDPAMTEGEAHDLWIEAPPGLTVVAVDGDRIFGTGKMGPNRPGPLGFSIVGTVPGAFAHRTLGRVGLHIMYRAF